MSNIYRCAARADGVLLLVHDVCEVGGGEALTLARFRPGLSPHHEPAVEINLSDGFSNLLCASFPPLSWFYCGLLLSSKAINVIGGLYNWTLLMVSGEFISIRCLALVTLCDFSKLGTNLHIDSNRPIHIEELEDRIWVQTAKCTYADKLPCGFECERRHLQFCISATRHHLERPMAIRYIAVKSFKDKSGIDNDDTRAR